MANEFENVKLPQVTREMLAAKIDDLKSSADLLEGHELDHAYRIVSSISRKPYQFHITGPVRIVPGWPDSDWLAEIVGPVAVPVPDGPGTIKVVGPVSAAETTNFLAVGSGEGPTVECPNCKHKLRINLSVSL
jgi:hypothetical protein